MEIERTFNPTKAWSPLPWSVSEVVPIFAGDGTLLAYCEKGYRKDLSELPLEIFNHELKSLNPEDPDSFAQFMSDYGLLGTNLRGHTYETMRVMDVKTVEDAEDVDKEFRYFNRHLEGEEALGRPLEETLRWFQLMQAGAKTAGLGWGDSSQLINPIPWDSRFVTPAEATYALNELMRAVRIAGALLKHEDATAIAAELKMPEEDIADEIVSSTDYINGLLKSLSPQMDVVFKKDGERISAPVNEFYERPVQEGSLDQAIALQIYRFSLSKGNYQECAQCGTVFVERRDGRRGGNPRRGKSNGENAFCCPACRNRYQQARYRERKREARAEAKVTETRGSAK